MFRGFFAAALVTALAQTASAALFAGNATNYVQGTIYSDNMGTINTYDMGFNDPTVVGDPTAGPFAGLTDFDFPPVEVISPFDPPSDGDQAVAIGIGGHITLTFPQPINVIPGGMIGVFTTSGIGDSSYPNGVAGSTAANFEQQSAIVKVSLNGQKWYSLGLINFNNPENYFTNADSPYETSFPDNAHMADFGQPFNGTLSDFNGLDYADMLTLLDGSAGGTWLDLSSTGLSQVQYIQFCEPADDVAMTSFVGISAISAADASLPEPASLFLMLIPGALLLRRRVARSI
jgi:hypothetical protein